jgi:crescentin
VAADRLETLQARTERQHEQISELARLVDDLTTRERTAARETAEATLMRDRANERARAAQEKLGALETEAAAASTARQAAIARAEELTRAHQLNLAELGRLTESKTELRQALQRLNLRMAGEHSKAQNRISEISAELERERSERAVAEGALATLRKDRKLILNQLSRYDAGFAEPNGADAKTAQSISASTTAGDPQATGGTGRRRGGAVQSELAGTHSG